jgi:prolipoprotein diacylglyceryl transferase
LAPVWNVDPILFTVPGIDWPVRWYGLFFACAFLTGFSLFRWQMERGGRGSDSAASFIIPGFIGTVVGARAGHIFFYNLDYFLKDPLWFFRIWEGGLASHGAALGLLAALAWQSRSARVPFWELCDRFSFSAAAGAALIRVGNLFNSEIVGKVAPPGSPFGIRFPRHDVWSAPDLVPARYPTQVLEFLLGALVLGALLVADRAMGRERRPRAVLAALFLILYFAGRFLVEFLKERQNAADILVLSRGQILSVLPLLFGTGLLVWALRRHAPSSGILPPSAGKSKGSKSRRQATRSGKKTAPAAGLPGSGKVTAPASSPGAAAAASAASPASPASGASPAPGTPGTDRSGGAGPAKGRGAGKGRRKGGR